MKYNDAVMRPVDLYRPRLARDLFGIRALSRHALGTKWENLPFGAVEVATQGAKTK